MTNARTPAPVLMLALLATAGCGSVAGDKDISTSYLGLTIGGACNGIVSSAHHRFQHIGVSVTQGVCQEKGLETVQVATIDDATGKPVDFDTLAEADHAAFQGWHAKLDPLARKSLENEGDTLRDFYVWFRVDESDGVNKEWLVSEPALAANATLVHENRLRAGAQQLQDKLLKTVGVELAGNTNPPFEYGIPVVRVRSKLADVEAIAGLSQVWRIDPVPKPEDFKQTYETYYYTTLESVLDWGGWDGTGITVALFENVRPDSWANLTGAPAGNCIDDFGQGRKCHCAAGPGPGFDSHMRELMGVVRRLTGTQGMANAATTLAANFGGNCTSNGPDPLVSALNWATSNGASVISRGECTGTGGSQTAADRFFDYKNSTWPFPSFVHPGGNFWWQIVCNKSRNGLVVGGAKESPGSSDRSLVTIDTDFSYLNGQNQQTDPEWPHLVAIGSGIDTAGWAQNEVYENAAGTSVAAPQVAGIIASIQEGNSTLKYWPEVIFPGLLVSANEDTDGTILNLIDYVDDRDGAGLVNAWEAAMVLQASSKVNGGNAPVSRGHDYGTMYSSSTPVLTYYSEQYVARVAAGSQLRSAVLLQSRVSCPQNPGFEDCWADPVALPGLVVYDGSTPVAASYSGRDNWAYVAWTNTSGVQKDYTLKIWIGSWGGLTATTWGVAWSAT